MSFDGIRSSVGAEEAVDLVTSMMRHDRHTRPTVREALQHPFFQTHNDKAGTFKRTSRSKSVNVDYIVCESTHNYFCPCCGFVQSQRFNPCGFVETCCVQLMMIFGTMV